MMDDQGHIRITDLGLATEVTPGRVRGYTLRLDYAELETNQVLAITLFCCQGVLLSPKLMIPLFLAWCQRVH